MSENTAIEQGFDRLAACLDTISTNVHELEGRSELRRIAELVRDEPEEKVLDKLFEELDVLFTHPDLESEKTCIYASFMELITVFTMIDDSEIVSQVDLIENRLLDYKSDLDRE
jgi:hypothetical protein